MIYPLLSGLLGAIVAVLVKTNLKHVNPFLISFIFFICATITLLVIGLLMKKISYQEIANFSHRDQVMLGITGLINAAAFTTYLLAINNGKLAQVVAIDRLAILYVVILSFIFLDESITFQKILGGALMIIGVMLL